MICFANAKINIGLHVTEKRPDGFHNLETIFYPIHGLRDVIEFQEFTELKFENQGTQVDTPLEKNLCVKAWQLLHETYDIPPIHIILYKTIPFGAGLGGGSADASFTLKALNEYFTLNLTTEKLEEFALQLGSDCPFFIQNKPIFAQGRGEIFSPTNLQLSDYWIYIVKPPIHVSTAEAFKGISPQKRENNILQNIPQNPALWNNVVNNDFEKTVCALHPEIAQAKQMMYNLGAEFAQMSGSGAAVFGIFNHEIQPPKSPDSVWFGKLE